jgi:hypothetical protein
MRARVILFHPTELLSAAQADLAGNESRQEQFKILCLALFAGLRKREIDTLLWRSIDLERRVIRVEATEFFQPKTEESLAEVALDDEFVALLRGWKARAAGQFVVEASGAPAAHPKAYRIAEHVEPLYTWLRARGVNDRKKPLHSLRKETGRRYSDGARHLRRRSHPASFRYPHDAILLRRPEGPRDERHGRAAGFQHCPDRSGSQRSALFEAIRKAGDPPCLPNRPL